MTTPKGTPHDHSRPQVPGPPPPGAADRCLLAGRHAGALRPPSPFLRAPGLPLARTMASGNEHSLPTGNPLRGWLTCCGAAPALHGWHRTVTAHCKARQGTPPKPRKLSHKRQQGWNVHAQARALPLHPRSGASCPRRGRSHHHAVGVSHALAVHPSRRPGLRLLGTGLRASWEELLR